MTAGENPVREPKCTVCGAFYSAHTAGPCRWCGLPIEHHNILGGRSGTTAGSPADCKAEKARMAAARRPEERSDLDREALDLRRALQGASR